MTDLAKITGIIDTSDSAVPLGLEIWLDNNCVLDLDKVTQQQMFEAVCSDSDGEHELQFVLKNKQSEHTTVATNGEIVKDAVLHISNIQINDIGLEQIVSDLAVYTHDFNHTQPQQTQPFYGTLGCNGTVTLKFTTPVYLWLLENM
jgi:hypothetical protein